MAPTGWTTPAAGVMATSPARIPETKPREVAFLKDQGLDNHPGQGAAGGGNLGHGQGPGGIQAALDGGTGIETEPADPQKAGAHHGHDQVVGLHGRFGIPLRLPRNRATTRALTPAET